MRVSRRSIAPFSLRRARLSTRPGLDHLILNDRAMATNREPASWEDSEPTMRDAIRLAYRHVRNAVRRSRWILVPGLLVAIGLFVYLRTAEPTYFCQVTFRALQGWQRAP